MRNSGIGQFSKLRARVLGGAALVAVAAVFVLQGCSSAALSGIDDAPKIQLVDIEPIQIGFLEQHYALTLHIENPNDIALPIHRLDYAIRLNKHAFAKGASRKHILVPAKSQRVVTVGLSSTTAALSRQLRALSELTQPRISYEIDGEIEIGDAQFRFPFSYAGEVGIFFEKRYRDPLPPGTIRI